MAKKYNWKLDIKKVRILQRVLPKESWKVPKVMSNMFNKVAGLPQLLLPEQEPVNVLLGINLWPNFMNPMASSHSCTTHWKFFQILYLNSSFSTFQSEYVHRMEVHQKFTWRKTCGIINDRMHNINGWHWYYYKNEDR